MFYRTRLLAVVVCALIATPLATLADEPLPRDPHNVYGEFDNGMKYIIRSHNVPPERANLFLYVDTGSLNESEKQNGLAHFLEHMAFNGSKHFAPGELIPYLNKLGMTFGADSNAFTAYQQTIYMLTMPDVSEDMCDKAMTIFSDYANGLLLLEEEVDKERGVILEELIAHKSPQERIHKEWMKKVFEGTRIAVHDIGGDEEQIKKFSREDFLDYWNTWYRPENMTLMVVGDLEPERVLKAAKKHIGGLKARAKGRTSLEAEIKPVKKTRAFVITDPEQVMGSVELLAINPPRPPIKTYKDYRFNEIENMGTWMVSRRLEEMVNKGTAAFRRGSVRVVSGFRVANSAVVPTGEADGEPEDWNKMLEQVVMEINRTIEHGFTRHEFELAKKELLADAERAVETEPTLPAKQLMFSFLFSIASEAPILSAQQQLDLMKKILADVSPSEVHQVFVDNFKTKNYTYVLTMPEKEELKLPTSGDVLAAAAAAWSRKTQPIKEEEVVDSILAKLPKPGQIASQTTDADLQITTATLSNGVTAHHRFMDYKKDQVLVSVMLAGGQIEETAANRGVTQVAALVNATSRLSSTQIRDLMTGKKVTVRPYAGLDTVTISITGSPEDLETGFQLAYAMLTDGKIEQSAFDNWKQRMLQQLEQLEMMPNGQLQKAIDETVYGGDLRLSLMTPEQVNNLNVLKGQEWLKHITNGAPIEVTVVGDISLDNAMALVTRYVGSLPQRSLGYEGLDSLRKVSRRPGPYNKTVKFESITPKAQVRAGFVGCDYNNVRDRRLLVMASRILTVRMIERIREEEQLVYSIRCYNLPAIAIPGLGMVFSEAPTDPEKADKLADTVLEMMREFAEKGPTADEVQVAKKQLANMLEVSMKEPGFWLAKIQELNYRNCSLAELKELPGVYQTFTAQQLQEVFKKYLQDDKMIRLIAVPETKAAEEPAKQKISAPAHR